ncbi:MAG: hypothetical protein EPN23_06665 [Verrucomicrobia bacterium]|nr:MAG: hypothetical protein EPN23_06665 [Verrucomicrobiota bacterium]
MTGAEFPCRLTAVMNQLPLLYAVLLVVGLFLIGSEIYLPGGIVGFLGGIALLGAAITGMQAFPPPWNFFSVVLIVVLAGVCIYSWIRFFPRSKIGKQLTLDADGSQFKATDSQPLLHQEGEALSPLRPAGLALLGGQRVDVVAESSWIPVGARIRVIEAAGNRIVVRQIAPPASPVEKS